MIIFVRHPRTVLNEQHVVRGQLDPPPNADGLQDIKKTVAQFDGVKVDTIYTDDFKRTRAMAAAISKKTGAPVVITPGLKTWDLGAFQGKDIDAVAPAVKKFMLQDHAKAVPRGESFDVFAKRFVSFMLPFYRTKKTVVMVTHGRPIMTAQSWEEADADKDPYALAGADLTPEPHKVKPGGIAIMSAEKPFKIIDF